MSNRMAFVDMNSFFASVEQQERAELRGRPVIVAPVLAETTCAIAASYEARAWGIKTGTQVKAARLLCPEIVVVEARPKLYVQYHHGIVEALNEFFVFIKVLSVDEMACGVSRLHTTREAEARLGQAVKRRLKERLGEQMRCSVGVAANVFLAKVASEMQKPDGLTILNDENMPGALFGRSLIDLPGIGPRMLARLERHGITTVQALWEADRQELRRAWGGVVGERWWYMLRGSLEMDYGAYQTDIRKSVGHSHVMPPEFRSREGAQQILLRLFSKALKRLRSYGQAASAVELWTVYKHARDHDMYGWRRRSARHLHSNDDGVWLRVVRPMVEALPPSRFLYRPFQVGIRFSGLLQCADVNLSLFDDPMPRPQLWETVDGLNKQGHSVELASVHQVRQEAPFRIAFGQPIS